MSRTPGQGKPFWTGLAGNANLRFSRRLMLPWCLFLMLVSLPGRSQANPPPPSATPQAQGPASPLEEPLRLLAEASRTYQAVQDYTCTMVKQERIKGQLQPEHIIQLKLRVKPFSVYMKWMGPKVCAGQEVCYVAGRNGGKMRVHSPGLLGAIGFVSIDPNDPRVLEHSRHQITETGIGNLIDQFRRDWERERLQGNTSVHIAEYEFAGRRCYRIETNRLRFEPQSYCYRVVLYLDKQSHLPVRVECYDWPRQKGNPQGELLEVFSYLNLRFNLGLGEEHFAR